MNKSKATIDDIKFILQQTDDIMDERIYEIPSEYIERVRTIRQNLSPKPGPFSFDFTPYWREPFNNISPESDVRIQIVMKAAQIGYTVAVLENAVLYFIGCEPKYVQFITADKSLARKIVQERIDPAIDDANLRRLIFAQSTRKGSHATGDLLLHKQYANGAINFEGANNPDVFRGITREITLGDEFETWGSDKKDGSISGVVINRSNAMAETRKILLGSTPLIKQSSETYRFYKMGDQRNYYIRCPRCGEFIVLHWQIKSDDHGKCGIIFEQEGGQPQLETVEYKCQTCGDTFKNYEKMLFLDGSGYWEPTAKAKAPHFRSYWLNALYSPVGVYSWEHIVTDWAKAWDVENNRMLDKEELRVFYNTKRGLPWEERGESISYTKAVAHRRTYPGGFIPNRQAIEDTGSPILILICSVDLQKDMLVVDVKGYTHGGATWTIDALEFLGETENLNSESWRKLDELITEKVYQSDDGKKYTITATFIDSGKYTEYAYGFCREFSSGVYPIKGERGDRFKGIPWKLMSKEAREKSGCQLSYLINTTYWKDDIARCLNRLEWNSGQDQPGWYPNFPETLRDDYFKQFESEYKKDFYEAKTGRYLYSYWYHAGGIENHFFDTYVYNRNGLHVIAQGVCESLCVEMSWPVFWDYAAKGNFYMVD